MSMRNLTLSNRPSTSVIIYKSYKSFISLFFYCFVLARSYNEYFNMLSSFLVIEYLYALPALSEKVCDYKLLKVCGKKTEEV